MYYIAEYEIQIFHVVFGILTKAEREIDVEIFAENRFGIYFQHGKYTHTKRVKEQ